LSGLGEDPDYPKMVVSSLTSLTNEISVKIT